MRKEALAVNATMIAHEILYMKNFEGRRWSKEMSHEEIKPFKMRSMEWIMIAFFY